MELFDLYDDERNFTGETIERGFDDVYVIHKDIPISELKLQPEEVQAAKWADRDEIYSLIDSGAFIPYYKSFIDMLFNYRIKRGNFSKE